MLGAVRSGCSEALRTQHTPSKRRQGGLRYLEACGPNVCRACRGWVGEGGRSVRTQRGLGRTLRSVCCDDVLLLPPAGPTPEESREEAGPKVSKVSCRSFVAIFVRRLDP